MWWLLCLVDLDLDLNDLSLSRRLWWRFLWSECLRCLLSLLLLDQYLVLCFNLDWLLSLIGLWSFCESLLTECLVEFSFLGGGVMSILLLEGGRLLCMPSWFVIFLMKQFFLFKKNSLCFINYVVIKQNLLCKTLLLLD